MLQKTLLPETTSSSPRSPPTTYYPRSRPRTKRCRVPLDLTRDSSLNSGTRGARRRRGRTESHEYELETKPSSVDCNTAWFDAWCRQAHLSHIALYVWFSRFTRINQNRFISSLSQTLSLSSLSQPLSLSLAPPLSSYQTSPPPWWNRRYP